MNRNEAGLINNSHMISLLEKNERLNKQYKELKRSRLQILLDEQHCEDELQKFWKQNTNP